MKSQLLLTLFASLALSSCVSTQRLSDERAENAPYGFTGALLNYELLGETEVVPHAGCNLRLNHAQNNRAYSLRLEAGRNQILAPLPAGLYTGSRLTCGVTKMWELEGLFPRGFEVQQGRISALGRVQFHFEDGELRRFGRAGRVDTLQALRQSLLNWPEHLADSVINAYTGDPISLDFLQADSLEGPRLQIRGPASEAEWVNPLLSRMEACQAEARQKDPLLIGHLQLEGHFKGSELKSLDYIQRSQIDTRFIDCVERELRQLQAGDSGEYSIRLTL